MAYVDLSIIQEANNRETCERVLGYNICRAIVDVTRKPFPKINEAGLKHLRELEGGVISRQALKRDLPERVRPENIPALISAINVIGAKDIDVKDVEDEDRVLSRGLEVMDGACRGMETSRLTPTQRRFHNNFCRFGRLKPTTELVNLPDWKSFSGDALHLGSAVMLGETDFITSDREHLLTIRPFVKEIKIMGD